jgi:hypothetical protein
MFVPEIDMRNPTIYGPSIVEDVDPSWAKFYADMYGLLFCYQSFESLNGPKIDSQTGDYVIPKTVNAARYLLNNLDSTNNDAKQFVREYEELVSKLNSNAREEYTMQTEIKETGKPAQPYAVTQNSVAVQELNKLEEEY